MIAKKRFEPMIECVNEVVAANELHYLEVSDENTKGMHDFNECGVLESEDCK